METLDCKAWFTQTLQAGHRMLVPEICYYELRRELCRTELRSGVASRGLQNLENLIARMGLAPITSDAIRLASDLWAQARHQNMQGAPDAALDGDMILCAQALLLKPAELKPAEWNAEGAEVVIATRNVAHLSSFAAAKTTLATSPQPTRLAARCWNSSVRMIDLWLRVRIIALYSLLPTLAERPGAEAPGYADQSPCGAGE